MAISPEVAGVIIAGILGPCGTMIAYILKPNRKDDEPGVQPVCMQHSGFVVLFESIEKNIKEIKTTIGGMDGRIRDMQESMGEFHAKHKG